MRWSSARSTLGFGAVLVLALTMAAWQCAGAASAPAHDIQVTALLPGAAMVVVDGKSHFLKVGESSPEGVTLLTADSESATVREGEVTLDLTLSNRVSANYEPRQGRTVDIPINRRGQFLVYGSINDRPVRFLVDTGATVVAMNSVHAERLGVDLSRGSAGTATTAGGRVSAISVSLSRVTVGDIEVPNVQAAVLGGDYPEDILLGMSFLQFVEFREVDGVLRLSARF
jgi:aspartyl protease family protein